MTEYQTLQAALAGLPPGMARSWIDEVLIRGTPDGGIGGAHVVVGVEMTDPMGGTTRVAKGPYPLDVLGGDFADVVGATVLAQQATIAERDATIAALKADVASKQAVVDQQAATLAEHAAKAAAAATPAEATSQP